VSEYLNKKALLNRLGYDPKGDGTVSKWKLRTEIQSGAFDADESEGTWKATAEILGRENAQLKDEVRRLRVELEKIANYERNEYESDLVVYAKCKRIAIQAISSTEPTGAERARAEIADRYKNALHGWHNPVDRAAGSYYNGYLNGVSETLRLLGITIPGINAPEGDGNDA